jgi:hypothetical protein
VNFLALCQKLREKCRVSGSGPTAVTGQSAEYARLISFVCESWNEIQRKHTDWRFMRASATAITVQGRSAYSPTTDFGLTNFGYWALNYANGDTFRNYDTAAGIGSEIFMDVWDYDWWRNAYLYGALRTSYARPIGVAVAPDNSLVCGPIPAAGYTLVGDYYKVPSDLVEAADIPSLPAQYHWAIIYKAMMMYGASEAAPEVYGEGELSYARIIRQIEATELRRPTLGGALA